MEITLWSTFSYQCIAKNRWENKSNWEINITINKLITLSIAFNSLKSIGKSCKNIKRENEKWNIHETYIYLFNLMRGKGTFVLCLDKIERCNKTEISSSKEFS